MTSDGIEFKLTGAKAVVAVVVLAGLFGFQWLRLGANLEARAREPIERELVLIYSGQLGRVLDGLDADGMTEAQGKQLVARAEALDQIEITDMSARHSDDDRYIVRVEFRVGGEPPPDGQGVRYFRLRGGSLGEWRVEYETSAFSYYSKLW